MKPSKYKYKLLGPMEIDRIELQETLERAKPVGWQTMKQHMTPQLWAELEAALGYETRGNHRPRLQNAHDQRRLLSGKYQGKRCYICQHYGKNKDTYLAVAVGLSDARLACD